MSGAVIHVTYAVGNALPELKSYTVVARPAADTKWEMRETPEAVIVETQSLRVRIDRKTGAVGFFDLMDNPILLESADGREISPSTQPGVQGTLVRQSFVLAPDEGIYGLGQHQQGIWNYRGHTVHLLQENREVGIPVILSSRGYSLLWDNPAVTDIDVGVPGIPLATQSAPARGVAPVGASENVLRWSSEVGEAIDYYFIYGPGGEASLRNYRDLTGLPR
jgi:alpha-D-xyloside xylohydrolase